MTNYRKTVNKMLKKGHFKTFDVKNIFSLKMTKKQLSDATYLESDDKSYIIALYLKNRKADLTCYRLRT